MGDREIEDENTESVLKQFLVNTMPIFWPKYVYISVAYKLNDR